MFCTALPDGLVNAKGAPVPVLTILSVVLKELLLLVNAVESLAAYPDTAVFKYPIAPVACTS